MTINVSSGPPKPPSSSGAPIASQPSSANCGQTSVPACAPAAKRATAKDQELAAA